MIVDHDAHVHTNLSRCSHDPDATPAALIARAAAAGLKTIGFADHLWDRAMPGASPWYRPQDLDHVLQTRRLLPADTQGVRVLVGCETEFCGGGKVGLSRTGAERLDFVLVPFSHFHMKGFVAPDTVHAGSPRGTRTGIRSIDMKRSILCCMTVAALLVGAASAAEEAGKGEWVNISDAPIAQLAEAGKKPGYAGPTAGIAVDPASGDVYLVINDQGLFKSTNRGKTFARCDGGAVSGRCETGFAIDVDPAGKRLAVFVVYGSSALTLDGGATWTKFKVSHLDVGAVDWTDGKSMVAIRHESGGTMCLSTDGGASWKDIGKGFKGVGIFGAQTLVATKEKEDGIFRSTDGGENWAKVSDLKPAGLAMRVYKGAGYWTSDSGLLVSKDKGATWSVLGTPIKAFQGPYFGKDDSHIVVVTKEGFQETRDGAKTWKAAAPLPEGIQGDRMTNCAWDAAANIFYVSRMTKPAFRFGR